MQSAYNFESTKQLLHNSILYYIICTDVHGNYSYINNRYAVSFKHVTDKLIGKPFSITMHPDDAKVCEEVAAKCFSHPGQLFPATIRKNNGKGGYIITQWEFTLIVENHEPQGIFCLGYDITEMEITKKEVVSINNDLQSKKNRLDSIAFEQSHYVRAPLSNIMGLAAILKNHKIDADTSNLLTMMEESCNKLDLVIRAITEKSKI